MSKNKDVSLKKSYYLKKTIPYIKKEKKLFIFTILLILINSGLNALTPFITKEILDDYLPDKNTKMIIYALIAYGVLIILLAIFKYLFSYINTLCGMRIERRIREEAMKKINYLPVDYFSLEPDGKIVAKITSDSGGVRMLYTTTFQIINALTNIIIVYIAMMIMDYRLGLLILIIVPIILLWITVYRKKIHKHYVELRETSSKITGKLNELITGTLVIQDYNIEELMLGDYYSLCQNYVSHDIKANRINVYFGWELLVLIRRFTELGLLMFAAGNVLFSFGYGITIGLISALIDNIEKMISPVNEIFNNLNELEDSLVGCSRVFTFLSEENDSRIFDGDEFKGELKGNVEFKHIYFAYNKGFDILKDVSLKVEAGKKIGVIGHTGSGKSTLMNLLLGYNDYDSGELLIDGVDLKTYNKASYRKNVGIILQTPALFAGTVRSNITMGRNYDDEEVIKVLDLVGASHIIKRSGDGLDTKISFRGENLSLGEKQLICFARILLRNPKILVLDEATANIDSETEEKIKHAIDIISKGRTCFIIAHRLSTIKDADEIILLDHGIIKGRGKHDTLYKTSPIYKDMYDSQFKKEGATNE